MNYGTLETELVTRLNAYFATQLLDDKFIAVEIPQNESEMQRPYEKAKVTVQYFTSSYQPAQSMAAVNQAETVTMRLSFDARTLRGDAGFYALVNHVKICLLGYKPANCTKKMWIDKYDLVFYENNTFSPYLDMQTETMNVETPETVEQDLFKYLTIESQCPA